jgi:hypothetical protein
MITALFALALLLPPQDMVQSVADTDLGLTGVTNFASEATPDSVPQSLAPTLQNASALFGVAPLVLGAPLAGVDDSVRRRPKAVEYGALYYTSLKIHRLASYLTLPLFAGQYLSGNYLWNHPDSHGLARDVHGPLAGAIAGLFAVNTVTGVYTLWEGRKEPAGRARRWVHGLSMLVADAGFVVVGATAPDREDRLAGNTSSGARTHRDVAIASMGLALGSYVMMLLWKD